MITEQFELSFPFSNSFIHSFTFLTIWTTFSVRFYYIFAADLWNFSDDFLNNWSEEIGDDEDMEVDN